MATLSDIQERIEHLREEIASKYREIKVLEETARVLLAIDDDAPIVQPAVNFSKLTMPEAAEEVLREIFPEKLHYREIAEIAFERGFVGQRTDPDSDRKTQAESLRRMMNQREDVFESGGEGKWGLNPEQLGRQPLHTHRRQVAQKSSRQKSERKHSGKTIYDYVVECFEQNKNRWMTVADIKKETGQKTNSIRKILYSHGDLFDRESAAGIGKESKFRMKEKKAD